MEFKEFKIEELFEVKTTKGLDEGKLAFSDSGTYNFIGRTKKNNGVKGKISKQSFGANPKNTISVSQIGTITAKYQPDEWYGSQNMFCLVPKNNITQNELLYIVTVLNAYLKQYENSGRSVYPTLPSLKAAKIKLPATPDGEIDFDYMDQYMGKIEKQHLEKIDLYLKVSGLDNYELTEEEKAVLKEEKEKREFKIGDLFEVESSKKIFHANKTTIKNYPEKDFYPYVTRTAQNNGVYGYINEKREYLNPKNTLSFAQDVFVCFYQNQDYFTGNNVKVLKPKIKFNQNIGLFITTVFNVLLKDYSWGVGSTKETIKNYKIKLPINSIGELDFDFMEKYISAITKTKIKNVVLEINKRLELYKQIQNE